MSSGFKSEKNQFLKCYTDQTWRNVCLPELDGMFSATGFSTSTTHTFSRSSSKRQTAVFGVGKSFSEAWLDAEDVCRYRATLITKKNTSTYTTNKTLIKRCNITSCEVINPPQNKKIIHQCNCFPSVQSERTAHSCIPLMSHNLESYRLNNFSDVHRRCLYLCSERLSTGDTGQAYCLTNFIR